MIADRLSGDQRERADEMGEGHDVTRALARRAAVPIAAVSATKLRTSSRTGASEPEQRRKPKRGNDQNVTEARV